MAMPSSQTMNYAQLCDIVREIRDIAREIQMRSESEMVPELRPVMPVDLFKAATKGNSDVLIPRLGLQPDEQRETRVNIEGSHSAPNEINRENQTVQFELQSATRFGDTILHLLITEGHNELALKVFERDNSLLKARNNMFETPLYCAAKVGNMDVIAKLIESNSAVVKDALAETNKTGDTALLVAAKHGHGDIGCVLMNLDSTAAYKVNDKKKTPLYIAINEGFTVMVRSMLEVDPTLACTPFSNGMFPVHEAARMGNLDLVMHFKEKYPDDAELRDPYGRNFFHIAAEENKEEFFNIAAMKKKYFQCVFNIAAMKKKYFQEKDELRLQQWREMTKTMITAQNYDGNTPLHIAAMKGNREIMKAIWKRYKDAKTGPTPFELKNKQGYTPLQLSAKQVLDTNKDINKRTIDKYLKAHQDYKFTRKWFRVVMAPPLENTWERTQVIGLGSVLITTVAFAAAFTIPGGYNQDNGTPVLGRQHMFQAFILANTLAFLQGFVSLFALILNGLPGPFDKDSIPFATYLFLCAASSMVVAFGMGLYVTLAPVSYPIAVFLLVFTLIIASPAVMIVLLMGKSYLQSAASSSWVRGFCFLLPPYALSLLIIFCLPFM